MTGRAERLQGRWQPPGSRNPNPDPSRPRQAKELLDHLEGVLSGYRGGGSHLGHATPTLTLPGPGRPRSCWTTWRAC